MVGKTQAAADFEKASRRAFWNGVRSWLTGRSNALLPYDEVRARLPLMGQNYRGLSEVPVEKIRGSVGRYRDFDGAFLPRQRQTRERWERVDQAYLADVRLPPVELFRIGEVYFVRDGNHRVSVARQQGQAYIDAFVTEIATPVPVTSESDLPEIIRLAEQADFFVKTNLHNLRPDQQIKLTVAGQYEKLLEHIHVHRWYLGVENEREMGWEESVESWYDRVYMPLVEIIRAQNVLDDFPSRTETDLYLWIIEHRAQLREDPGEAPLEEAAADFVRSRSERPVRRAMRSLRDSIITITDAAADAIADLGVSLPDEE